MADPYGWPETAKEAKAMGWSMEGVYPHPNQPLDVHSKLHRQGLQAIDLGFTRKGKLVPPGQYVIWTKPLESQVAS